MRVHSILAAGAGLIILAACAVHAQELTKEAKIERLLALTNSDSSIDQIFSQIKAATASQVQAGSTPEQRAKAQEILGTTLDRVKARMSFDKMLPLYVKIYAEVFSGDEIDGMLAFYESPAGRAALEKRPVLMSRMMAAAQAQMADLMPEIQRSAKEAGVGMTAEGRKVLQEARQAKSRGDVAAAELKYNEALVSFQRNDDHMGMFECLEALGQMASNRNELDRAAEFYRTELEVQQHPHLPPTAQLHPLIELSRLYPRMGRWADAAAALSQVASIWSGSIDPNSAGLGRYLSEEGFAFEMSGDHSRAEKAFRQALAVYGKAGIADTPAGWEVMERLARCLMAQAKPGDAEPYLKEAVAGLDRTVGRTGLSDSAAGEYARLLRGQSRMEEAEQLEKSRAALPQVQRVGKGVAPPQVTQKSEPEYTEEARRKRVVGDVMVSFEVTEQGVPDNLHVLRPLGFGLDENALKAVRTWRFRPAVKDGNPVRVQAQVEVNFRLL